MSQQSRPTMSMPRAKKLPSRAIELGPSIFVGSPREVDNGALKTEVKLDRCTSWCDAHHYCNRLYRKQLVLKLDDNTTYQAGKYLEEGKGS